MLSNREHSALELTKKLKEHAQTPDELAQVLEWLESKGFINEQRVLESVLYRRSAKLGFARVAREMQEKGLAPQAIQKAVNDLKATEADRARVVWEKKFKEKAVTALEKSKQMRFLLSRGFASSVVQQVVNSSKGSCAQAYTDRDEFDPS